MGRTELVLDARLGTIAEMVGQVHRLADIGADHGRLGAHLLQEHQAETVEFTDISAASLNKARSLMEELGLLSHAVFSVGDGAEALSAEPDAAVIAGMGGETIAGIIERGYTRFGAAKLLLAPNVRQYELRLRSMRAGYQITDERIVQDGGRNYVILEAVRGNAAYTERELHVGPILLKTMPDSLKPYALFRLRVAKKALSGAEGRKAEAAEAFQAEIDIWEEVLKCL